MHKTPTDLVLGGNFTLPGYHMVSALAEVAEAEHTIAIGKSGRIWLYQPGKATVHVSGGPGSGGFGGRTVTFKLAKGLGNIDLVGPWRSNTDSFFKDTGIDVRMNHVTWGCVARRRTYNGNDARTTLEDLVYFDKEPTAGLFDRMEYVAWELSKKLGEPLYVYSESTGGSSCGLAGMPRQMRIDKGLEKDFDF